MQKFIKRTPAAAMVALALVAATGISFIALTQASGNLALNVSVSDSCGPVVAKLTVVNGPDDGAQGFSNSNGQFTFPNLNAGVFYLHVDADGHTSKDTAPIVLTTSQSISITLDRTSDCPSTTPTTPTLTPTPNAQFQLHVSVSDSCAPVVAKITIVNGPDDGAEGFTDSNGQFTFPNLDPGVFYLHIVADNHVAKDTSAIVLTSDQTMTMTLDRTNGGCAVPPTPTTPTPPTNHPPVGFFDVANCDLIGGWVFDPDNTTAQLIVQIYADGPQGSGTLIGTVSTDVPRPDVNAAMGITGNHGFNILTPAFLKDGRKHQIWVYAKDTTTQESISFAPFKSFDSSTCIVTPTPNPAPTPTYTFNKTVRVAGTTSFGKTATIQENVDGTGVNQVEFKLTLDITSGTVSNLVINDQLPAGLTFVPGTLSVVDQGNRSFALPDPLNHIILGTLSVNMTRDVFFKVNVDQIAPGTCKDLVNRATINSDNSGSQTDTATVHVCKGNLPPPPPPTPDYTFTKLVRDVTTGQTNFVKSTTANFGDTVEFKLSTTITSGTVNNLVIDDTLPDRLNLIAGSVHVVSETGGNSVISDAINHITLGNLAVGAKRDVFFEATVAGDGLFSPGTTALVNVAKLNSNIGAKFDSANVVVTKTINPPPPTPTPTPVPFITFTKTAWDDTQNHDATTVTAKAGDEITYIIKVTNTGNGDQPNFVFADNVADVATLADIFDIGSGSLNNNLLTFPAVTIPANSTIQRAFRVRIKNPVPTGTDCVMSNTFGNVTVNVNVSCRPFVAPPTGATTTLSVVFGLLTMVGFAGYRSGKLVQVARLTGLLKS